MMKDGDWEGRQAPKDREQLNRTSHDDRAAQLRETYFSDV